MLSSIAYKPFISYVPYIFGRVQTIQIAHYYNQSVLLAMYIGIIIITTLFYFIFGRFVWFHVIFVQPTECCIHMLMRLNESCIHIYILYKYIIWLSMVRRLQ